MKRIFATPMKEPAIPPKPKTAASSAITRQVMANCNMVNSSNRKVVWPVCRRAMR
jgi:hypothetical protein